MKKLKQKILLSVIVVTAIPVWASVEEARTAYEKMDFGVAAKLVEGNIGSNDPEIIHIVARAIFEGNGYPLDAQKALEMFRRAADLGFYKSQYNIGMAYKKGIGVKKDIQQAEEWFKKSFASSLKIAENGDASAQALVGEQLLFGLGVVRNIDLAHTWLKKSSDNGNGNGHLKLANLYLNENGIYKNVDEAIILLNKSIQKQNRDAMSMLASEYFKGLNIDKNLFKSFELIKQAAEKGSLTAQHNLGSYYINGTGVTRDAAEGVKWIVKSANNGLAESQSLLGDFYRNGIYTEKDDKKAFELYRKASEQDHPKALMSLGDSYWIGSGTIKDESQAVTWWLKAAKQNYAQAQIRLAEAYKNGVGGSTNNSKSYFWYLIASNENKDKSITNHLRSKINDIEKILDTDSRIKIQQIASAWNINKSEPELDSFSKEPKRNQNAEKNEKKKFELQSTGSGFHISRDYVVTNYHVINGCKKIKVNDQYASLISHDGVSDLALLKTDVQMSGLVAKLRTTRVKVGEDISVAGYPLQGVLTGFNITRGNISSLTGIGGDSRIIQITAPIQPGNSGGPLLDIYGNIVGVVVSKLSWKVSAFTGDLPQNVNFAINMNTLSSFLNSNNIQLNDGANSKELKLVEVAERARLFTTLIQCWGENGK